MLGQTFEGWKWNEYRMEQEFDHGLLRREGGRIFVSVACEGCRERCSIALLVERGRS